VKKHPRDRGVQISHPGHEDSLRLCDAVELLRVGPGGLLHADELLLPGLSERGEKGCCIDQVCQLSFISELQQMEGFRALSHR
jgi:hypothetical protein